MNFKLSLFVTLLVTVQNHASTLQNSRQSMKKCDKSPKVYLFGGLYTMLGQQFADIVSRYDSATGTWGYMKNDTPDKHAKGCGAVVGEQIYLFGGFTADFYKPIITTTATVYDTSTDTYTMLRAMPEPRQSCGAAALKGSIYVAGGSMETNFRKPDFTSEEFEPKVPDSEMLSGVFRYDIGTNKWSHMKSMNTNRYGLQLIELGGLLYAIGGGSYYKSDKSVEVYNPATDQWSFVASSNYAHRWFGATAHEGKIYAYSIRGFEVYSPEVDKWTVLNPPSGFIHGMRPLVSLNGKLWSFGGAYYLRGEYTYWSDTNAVHSFDPANGLWTKQHDTNWDRKYHTAFVVNFCQDEPPISEITSSTSTKPVDQPNSINSINLNFVLIMIIVNSFYYFYYH